MRALRMTAFALAAALLGSRIDYLRCECYDVSFTASVHEVRERIAAPSGARGSRAGRAAEAVAPPRKTLAKSPTGAADARR